MLDTFLQYAWVVFLAPVLLPILALVRSRLRRLGLESTEALLYPFLRRVRRTVSAAVNLRRYCRLGLAAPETQALLVPGVRGSTHLNTDDLFVNLNFESQTNDRTKFNTSNILGAGSRIRVIGEPGSGKSSLVKRVYRDLCRFGLETPGSARIPLMLELKNLSVPEKANTNTWLLQHLRRRMAANEGHDMDAFFDLSVRQNGVVVLLDGLDEVSTKQYDRVIAVIGGLSRRLAELGEHNSIVITMRVQFHHKVHRDLDDMFPTTLFVRPFDPGDIYEFLRRWFARTDTPREAARIYNELSSRPSLRELCTNPLILAMYTANYQKMADTAFPDTRTAFYRAVVEELVVHRRSRQRSDRTGRQAAHSRRYGALGRLAYGNLLDTDQAANSISWSDAVEALREAGEPDPVKLLEELEHETGLVVEERPGQSIRFLHLTFCEFFAAVAAIEYVPDGWHTLIAALPEGSTRLREVIPFAYAILRNVDQKAALTSIAELGDRVLYARCVLETQDYLHPTFSGYLSEEQEWLTGVDHHDWDELWLTRLHLYRTVVTDSRAAFGESRKAGPTVDQLFADLVEDQRERLVKLFSSFATHSPRVAFDLAHECGVDLLTEAPEILYEQCADPPFLSFCVDRADTQPERASDWASLFFRAGLNSHAVAELLSSEAPPEAWRGALEQVDRRYLWHPIPGTSRRQDFSLYSAAISIALASPKPVPQNEPDTDITTLRKLRSPARLIRAHVGFALAFTSLIAGLWSASTWVPELAGIDTENGFTGFVTVITFSVLLVPVFLALPYFLLRDNAYRTILNLHVRLGYLRTVHRLLFVYFSSSLRLFNRPLMRLARDRGHIYWFSP